MEYYAIGHVVYRRGGYLVVSFTQANSARIATDVARDYATWCNKQFQESEGL